MNGKKYSYMKFAIVFIIGMDVINPKPSSVMDYL